MKKYLKGLSFPKKVNLFTTHISTFFLNYQRLKKYPWRIAAYLLKNGNLIFNIAPFVFCRQSWDYMVLNSYILALCSAKKCNIFAFFYRGRIYRGRVSHNYLSYFVWTLCNLWLDNSYISILRYKTSQSRPSPVISIRLNWKLCHLACVYAASHRFLIKLWHYSIDQLYLHKVL